MDASEMLGRLDDLRTQRGKLRGHLAGAGDLRAAQLWDGMAATRDAEVALWRAVTDGRVGTPGGDQWHRLVIRAAYGAIDAATALAFENREHAKRLRAAARQVQAEGEAALTDTGMAFVPGVGVVRGHEADQ